MLITEFEWDENNIEHIARHRVTPEDVEEVAFDDEPYIRKIKKSAINEMLGQTASGRYLKIIYVIKEKHGARVITARDMNDWERKYYRRRGK